LTFANLPTASANGECQVQNSTREAPQAVVSPAVRFRQMFRKAGFER
jgi:hypothetical protein